MKILTRIILAIFLWATWFSAFAQIETKMVLPDSSIVFKTDDMEGVIFGKDFRLRYRTGRLIKKTRVVDPLLSISNDSNATRYVPSIETAIDIELKLKNFIHDSDSLVSDNLPIYIKQYFGYITSTGDTIIYINCFSNNRMKELVGYWQIFFVRVCDGGHQYFNVKYNITRKQFFDLWFNGWA